MLLEEAPRRGRGELRVDDDAPGELARLSTRRGDRGGEADRLGDALLRARLWISSTTSQSVVENSAKSSRCSNSSASSEGIKQRWRDENQAGK